MSLKDNQEGVDLKSDQSQRSDEEPVAQDEGKQSSEQENLKRRMKEKTQIPFDAAQSKEEDTRSVFVQNVEYATTKEELTEIFKECGEIEKITIPQTHGQGKGFAYIQFTDKSSVELAMMITDSIHRGRAIKVLPKRTNQHGFKKKPFKPNGFGGQFLPFMNKNLMKGFMFGGQQGFKKKFDPH